MSRRMTARGHCGRSGTRCFLNAKVRERSRWPSHLPRRLRSLSTSRLDETARSTDALASRAPITSHRVSNRPELESAMTDSPDVTRDRRRAERTAWKAIVEAYQKPSVWRASWQLLNTLGSYVVLWYLMGLALTISWWIAIPLAILAGGLLVRTFIIF